jgi:peptide chain release factor 1
MKEKVSALLKRFGEVEELMGRSEVISDKTKYKELTTEHSYLCEINDLWKQYVDSEKALEENQKLLREETDPDFLDLLRQDIQIQKSLQETLEKKLHLLLVPPDPRDSRNIILML